MNYSHCFISCGAAKNYSNSWQRAYDLYNGLIFREAFKTAITLAPTVYILSAGYGCVAAEDFLLSYNQTLTGNRKSEIIKNLQLPEYGCAIVTGKYQKLLPVSCVNLIPKYENTERQAGVHSLLKTFAELRNPSIIWAPGAGVKRELIPPCLPIAEIILSTPTIVPWA